MKNQITTIILLVAIVLIFISTLQGIEKLQILSISQLQQKNDEVNNKINQASTLSTLDYPDNIETLKETYDKYLIQKQKYEELSQFVDEDNSNVYEKKQYDIGYLWRVLGKYATVRNLKLGIDVQKNNKATNNLYDLNFNVSGLYTNISQFIVDLENDSDLYFRIYNFKMSGNGEVVSSTFSVKDINIDPSTIINVETMEIDSND